MRQSIEFDTAEDEAGDVALALAYAYGYSSIEELVDAEVAALDEDGPAVTTAYPGGWTKPKMKRYIAALKPNAKVVLSVMAQHAPKVEVETVQNGSGLDGYIYAGSMSSFGFAAKNTHGVKDKPFTKVNKHYEIDESLAQLVLQVLDEE
ncbi:hypothetical protein EUA93_12660 [Nocardioides oleivorans]|uniref:Uncharacterized protein n=1 Tax=Nocardioides oleivorans TaxID=273676 RepID=A0A4Q2S0H9_9ACTN|nr:hypothetical protein [Nocardioides oleivorans]RYB95120.1 hypothetical protein EUA93_12660 [Nocardioides oleivorans]